MNAINSKVDVYLYEQYCDHDHHQLHPHGQHHLLGIDPTGRLAKVGAIVALL